MKLSSIVWKFWFVSELKMYVYIIVYMVENTFVLVWWWHVNAGAVAATVNPVENNHSGKRPKAELSSVTSSPKVSQVEDSFEKDGSECTVSITVVGASGDLAKKKIFPALFALYYEGCLPKVGCR